MATYTKKLEKRAIITTKPEFIYEIIIETGEVIGVTVKSKSEKIMYYLEPNENQLKLTDEIFEAALKTMLGSNICGFNIIYTLFYTSKHKEYCYNIASKVFKDYWNELYNTVAADDVFERKITLENFDKTYDFFQK